MFKIVIPVDGKKAVQVEKDVPTFIGMKIGERFDGSMIGLNGYVLQVTGGSDKDGFPMRRDLSGTARKRALLVGGVGCKPKVNGIRKRKTIRGNRIGEDISQVNVKIVEKGKEGVEKLLGLEKKPEETKKEGEKKEDEPKKEEPKPEPKKEKTPKETKNEEKPVEPEKVEEKKPEAKSTELKPESKSDEKTEEKEPEKEVPKDAGNKEAKK